MAILELTLVNKTVKLDTISYNLAEARSVKTLASTAAEWVNERVMSHGCYCDLTELDMRKCIVIAATDNIVQQLSVCGININIAVKL